MVLDVCLDSTTDVAALRDAMERTHRWALRSLAARTDPGQALFAIVQGGVSRELRRESAAFLVEHPFDGFALGGLSVGDTRSEREDITHFAAELLPADRPRYLMGVGTPADLLHAIVGGDRSLRLRAPDAPRVAGDGVHLDGPREGHARARGARGRPARRGVRLLDLREVQPRVPAPPLQVQRAARSAAPLRSTTSATTTRSWPRRAPRSSAATYAAFAEQKLEAIDRHEHSDRRFGGRARLRAHVECLSLRSFEVVATRSGARAMLDRRTGEVMHPLVGARRRGARPLPAPVAARGAARSGTSPSRSSCSTWGSAPARTRPPRGRSPKARCGARDACWRSSASTERLRPSRSR